MTRKTEKILVAGLILFNFVTAILSTLLVGGPDDAFITYTFSKNLAEGHGITYYPGAPPIYGSTTLTWTLMLALAGFVGFSIPVASTLLGALFWALCYALVYVMFREKLGRWPMLAVLVLEALSLRVEKLGQGMEAGFYAFLILLCFFLYSRGKVMASLLLSVVLVATRLDGGLVPLMIGIHYLLSGDLPRDSFVKSFWSRFVSLLKIGWPALLGLLGVFVFCLLYFGTFIPNSFLAKAFLWAGRPSFTPQLYFEFLSPWYVGNMTPPSPLRQAPLGSAIALAVMFFAGLGWIRAIVGWRPIDALPLIWLPVYVIAIWIFALTPSNWYAAPTIPLIYVAFVYGIFEDLRRLESWRDLLRTPGALPVFCAAGAVCLMLLFGGVLNGYSLISQDPLGAETPLQGRHAELARAVDREIRERNEKSPDIVAFEVGRLGFETSGRVHDILGLVSPEVVEKRIEDPMWLVKRYEPEYLVITDSRGYRLTGPILRSDIYEEKYEPVYTYTYPYKTNELFKVFRVYHRVEATETNGSSG